MNMHFFIENSGQLGLFRQGLLTGQGAKTKQRKSIRKCLKVNDSLQWTPVFGLSWPFEQV
jgi:hypothetical protein